MPNQNKNAPSCYNIRRATKDDALDITFLGKKAGRETKLIGNLGWNQEKTYNFTKQAIEREEFLVLVQEENETKDIVGILVAFYTPCFFSDEAQATILIIYTIKDHRDSKMGEKFLDEYEEWARESGVARVNGNNLNILETEKVEKMYKKRGYELFENTFMKELK